MNHTPHTPARALLTLALKIAPGERQEWFAAMAAEYDHVPASARGRFALGCLFAAVRERVISPPFRNAAARGLLIGGAVFWAALNLRLAGRMSAADAALPEALGYGTALLFAIGALATARFGYRATIALAAPLIAVLAVAAAYLSLGSAPTPSSQLYLALLVEDMAVLACAIGIAICAEARRSAGHEPA
jgi:hypothetical protein